MLSTDISNCYGTIDNRLLTKILPKNVGSTIQSLVQMLQGGVGIGIPQGAVIYDFLAELILGELDKKLTQKLQEKNIKDGYFIIRYRDDYRIFSNDKNQIEIIFSTLQKVLLEANCLLGASKTNMTNSLIINSIKKDKLYHIENTPISNKKGCDFNGVQKFLIYVLLFSEKHPNAGQLCNMLGELKHFISQGNFHDFKKHYKEKKYVAPILAILVKLIEKNPKIYKQCLELIYIFTHQLSDDNRKELLTRIKKKILSSHANNVFSEIWLQCLMISLDEETSTPYTSPLCQFAEGKTPQLWERKFLKGKYAKHNYEQNLCNLDDIKEKAKNSILSDTDDFDFDINLDSSYWGF